MMKTKLFVGLFFAAAFGVAAQGVQAQEAEATASSGVAAATATTDSVAPASQAVAAQPCQECEEVVGFGGRIRGGFLGDGFGGRGLRSGRKTLQERMREARAADHPIVEASPYANPNGSLQDWSRFRYYPYAYYPHNFSDTPNMSVPKYQPGYQNYYPVPRRYHEGGHFHLDVF